MASTLSPPTWEARSEYTLVEVTTRIFPPSEESSDPPVEPFAHPASARPVRAASETAATVRAPVRVVRPGVMGFLPVAIPAGAVRIGVT